MIDLVAIKERCEKIEGDCGFNYLDCIDFVSHARTDVPELVEEVERLREYVELLEREIQQKIAWDIDVGMDVGVDYGKNPER